jgi:AcrR family transcriptional regulator
MSPKPDVSEARSAQIIEAAMTVFARQGFHQARMDDIAEETGLSKGTLYLYFKSKDAIIAAILKAFLNRELVQARRLLTREGTAIEKLNRFVDIVVQDFTRMLPLMSIYLEFLSQAFRRQAVRDAIRESFVDFRDVLVDLVQQGIDRREFRPVDPEAAALAIGAVIEGMVLLWVYDSQQVILDKHIQAGVQLILDGLKA